MLVTEEDITTQEDAAGVTVRIQRGSSELIRLQNSVGIATVSLGTYQKGRNCTLIEACTLAVDFVRDSDQALFLIHEDSARPVYVNGDFSPFEIENKLNK